MDGLPQFTTFENKNDMNSAYVIQDEALRPQNQTSSDSPRTSLVSGLFKFTKVKEDFETPGFKTKSSGDDGNKSSKDLATKSEMLKLNEMTEIEELKDDELRDDLDDTDEDE